MDVTKIVENIQRICKEKGTTPTVAGKESGAGKDLVSAMKRRGVLPSIEKMRLLAEYLGVTTSELLGETKKPTVQDDGLTEAEQALMDLFRQLTPDQQDMVIRMVQAAADKQ
ncbi:MAG: helix-turn-helix domain-containing protein [Flintibacter sp.]|uniref:helix-turn-helix domain-containing protein n=1 Tax=Flintibacter sp. TaxID=1918624 RepID=UPI002D7E9AD3|nr:helix-turn-helix transcriptional regulator [Flintibacter sp.]MCI7158186.1 helix-turn-helix domain-containing protein [Flintibacter sp.]MCI7659611.1 helix-turn-helix domain-containing protein [Flintibacter sp.]